MKTYVTLLVIFFCKLSFADKIIKAPLASNEDYQAYVLSSERHQYVSEYLYNQQTSHKNRKLLLDFLLNLKINLLKNTASNITHIQQKAERIFLSGHWDAEEKNAFSSSISELIKENKSVQLSNLLKRIQFDNQTHIEETKPWIPFNNLAGFKTLVVSGQKFEISADLKLFLPEGPMRVSIFSDTYMPHTVAYSIDALKQWRPDKKLILSGDCDSPKLNSELNKGLFTGFFTDNCQRTWLDGKKLWLKKGPPEFKNVLSPKTNTDYQKPKSKKANPWLTFLLGTLVGFAVH